MQNRASKKTPKKPELKSFRADSNVKSKWIEKFCLECKKYRKVGDKLTLFQISTCWLWNLICKSLGSMVSHILFHL
jgi:hypothetical protein